VSEPIVPVLESKKLVFVLGGAKSGKSSWALKYTEKHYESRLFLATARILDEEMAERVKSHKLSRGPEWHLLEEPLEIAAALESRSREYQAVLIDCLTVWLSNVLLEKGEGSLDRYLEDLLGALSARKQAVTIVSNEVGTGIVPENPLGRKFRDLAGHLNQKIAEKADGVVLVIAGLPMYLKGIP
jgi:adenosylcobinamide kinase/adenosylcobinamide-phosphate guanylyltransferase